MHESNRCHLCRFSGCTAGALFPVPLVLTMIAVVKQFVVMDILAVTGVIVAVVGMHHAKLHTNCPFNAPAASSMKHIVTVVFLDTIAFTNI